jgi:hypothetical protein
MYGRAPVRSSLTIVIDKGDAVLMVMTRFRINSIPQGYKKSTFHRCAPCSSPCDEG